MLHAPLLALAEVFGIPPQVAIDLRRVADPVGFVDRALSAGRSR